LIHLLAQVLILRAPFGGQGADSGICGNKQYYCFPRKFGMSHLLNSLCYISLLYIIMFNYFFLVESIIGKNREILYIIDDTMNNY